MLSRNYHLTHGGPRLFALSALDIALWDAHARSLGVPISHLLGGQVRTTMRAYASTGYITDTDLGRYSDELAAAIDEGFTAMKVRIGTGAKTDRRRAEIARELLGSDGQLMVDYNANGTLDSARKSIVAIRDLDIAWYEEPLPPDDLTGWELLRETGVTLSGGESLATRFGFRDAVASRRFDIHQPDLAGCGGLTEGHAIAQMVTAYNSQLSPHCWGSAVLAAASLQLLASLPEAPFGDFGPDPVIFEFDRGPNPQRDSVGVAPIELDGPNVVVPGDHGLGTDIDTDYHKQCSAGRLLHRRSLTRPVHLSLRQQLQLRRYSV